MQVNNAYSTTTKTVYDTKRVGKSELNSQDFLNLLVTQLKNQDPLQPMDNADFTQQTTMFSQLEELTNISKAVSNLTDTMQSGTGSSQLFSASNFLGKAVDFTTAKFDVPEEGRATLTFSLPDTPSQVEIKVIDSSGTVVGLVRPSDAQKGKNDIKWDPISLTGQRLDDGEYSFEVRALDADQKEMDASQVGHGVVYGVETIGGKVFLNLGQNIRIPSTDIVSVWNAVSSTTEQ